MYSGEELTTLFSSSLFLKESNGPWEQGSKASSRYWIPFLCLFHGMRAGEAAQLYVSNIKEESGIAYLEITDYGDADEGQAVKTKRVKTSSSVRRVPIHPEMAKLGFVDFVETRKKASEGLKNVPLFAETTIDPSSDLPASNAISKWFSRIRNRIFGTPAFRGDKGLHSFRHGFRAASDRRVGDKLEQIVSRDLVDAICGWVGQGMSRSGSSGNSGDIYGTGKTGFPIQTLYQAISKIEFPGLDLSHLYFRK